MRIFSTPDGSGSVLDINDLFFFTLVVQYGGFSAASRETGIEKTRLSRRVSELEQRVQVELLKRSTRSLVLTDAGETLYLSCLPLVEQARIAYENLKVLNKKPSGVVRVICPIGIVHHHLTRILPEYLAKHPDVIVFVDSVGYPVNIVDEKYDISIKIKPSDLPDERCEAHVVDEVSGVLVACPGTVPPIQRLNDINTLSIPFVCRSAEFVNGCARYTFTDVGSHESKTLLVRPRLIVNDLISMCRAIKNGVGVGVIPLAMAEPHFAEGSLVQVLPRLIGQKEYVVIEHTKLSYKLPAVKTLVDHLTSGLRASIKSHGWLA